MSSAVESGSPATDQQKHTPADQVKEAATEFEAKRDPFHPEHISTNTAEAHEKPFSPPELLLLPQALSTEPTITLP